MSMRLIGLNEAMNYFERVSDRFERSKEGLATAIGTDYAMYVKKRIKEAVGPTSTGRLASGWAILTQEGKEMAPKDDVVWEYKEDRDGFSLLVGERNDYIESWEYGQGAYTVVTEKAMAIPIKGSRFTPNADLSTTDGYAFIKKFTHPGFAGKHVITKATRDYANTKLSEVLKEYLDYAVEGDVFVKNKSTGTFELK
jgi:hypothetical protein